MVRLSITKFGIAFARRQKYMKEKHGHYKVYCDPKRPSYILKEQGINVEDPLTYLNPPKPEWQPSKDMPDDFRIQRYQKPKEEPIKEAWHLSSSVIFTEGIDQACLLTKTQRFDGLPKQIQDLVGKYSLEDQDKHVKDAILQSQVWDSTYEKLPKLIDLTNVSFKYPRMYGIPDSTSAHILMSKLLRMCQSMCGKFPEMATDRRVLYKPSLETTYMYRGEQINIKNINEFMVCGYTPLPEMEGQEMIEQSADHELLDMFPILPTIDLQPAVLNQPSSSGAFKKPVEVPWSNPQIIYRINAGNGKPRRFQSYNLLTTFGVALAEARNRYKVDSGPLETPVTVINVNMNHNTVNSIVFQLNTLDFENGDGIKNFAWFDSVQMFSKKHCQPWLEPQEYRKTVIKPPTYSDYNKEAFQKLLALYLYHYAK